MTERTRRRPVRTSTERLIALGRDREAVAEAVRDSGQAPASGVGATHPGGPMDGPQQLDEIMPLLDAVVDGINPDQLDSPTACATFNVASILEHMIGGATAFAPAFRGDVPSDAPFEGVGEDFQAHFHRAMADLLQAVHHEGAQERTLVTPIGELPGSVFARFVAFDGLVHGWDLATATGQPYAPREELVAEVDGFVRSVLAPEMRDGDTFAAEATPPPDATPIERLVAFSGRQVR